MCLERAKQRSPIKIHHNSILTKKLYKTRKMIVFIKRYHYLRCSYAFDKG
ncbi:hypothetical protein HMPREF3190_00411 [Umbribacter vaginalis]|nr:hypothetical protein HMPREF3190_00411 [Coriobacteriales bacterium DNF00809]